jgi:hypothetical protein
MSAASSIAPVPRVDRVLGALVTFAAGAVVGVVLAVVLAPDPTSAVVPVAGVLAGTVATGILVVAGGYDRLLTPVEGRRWATELAVALALVVAVLRFAEAAGATSDLVVVALVACSLLGTRWLGDAAADARDWYDRDAYYRERDR